jgi:hypothetical protein
VEVGAGAGQDRGDLPRLRRPGEEETLAEVAAKVSQCRPLFVGLDPLGDRLQFERLTQLDDGLGQRRVLAVRGDPLHEGAVDLENVHREALEVAQRGVPGAEVVDGQANTE